MADCGQSAHQPPGPAAEVKDPLREPWWRRQITERSCALEWRGKAARDTPRLISRPIDRYSIGDRTPGLQTGPDGSVTIYMQTQEPTPEKRSNWLPTPAGAFRPVIRMYQPRQEVLDGTYTLPAITRPGSPADACNVEVVKRDARVLRHQCSGAGGPAV